MWLKLPTLWIWSSFASALYYLIAERKSVGAIEGAGPADMGIKIKKKEDVKPGKRTSEDTG